MQICKCQKCQFWLNQNCNVSQLSNILQELSDTTNSRRPHSLCPFWILRACKTYCNQIRIWTWQNTSLHTFVKIILDHGSQTSTHCFLNPVNIFLWYYIIFCKVFCITEIVDLQPNQSNYTYQNNFGPWDVAPRRSFCPFFDFIASSPM